MPKNSIQFDGADGCVYAFDLDTKQWYKFCPVKELPLDVKRQISELKDKADILRDVVLPQEE
jgi:hypothetical protein